MKKHGFTIVELLIVMGLMGAMVAILSQVFGAILSMKLRSETTSAVAQDSRYLIARLSYDVARASAVSLPNPSTLVLTIGGASYTYALQNNALVLTTSGGTAALTSVGTKITALNFNTTSVPLATQKSVHLSLTIAPTNPSPDGGSGARLLTTTVATR